MNQQLLSLGLIVALLSLALGLLALRLARLYLRRGRDRAEQPPVERDLLVDTLREQTLREREAQRASREKSQELAALHAIHGVVMAHVPVGLLVLDQQGEVRFANTRAETMLARANLADVHLREIHVALFLEYSKLRADPNLSETQFQLTIDQSTVYLVMSLTGLPQDRLLLTLVDVTKERELEERLRYKREIELMGEMAGGIAHEVKNTLAAIQGHVQMLGRGDPSERGRKILDESDRLLRFVREFMKSSKDETVHKKPIAVKSLMEELADHWRGRPNGSRILFEPPGDEGLIIHGDSALLANVIDNLILNGQQACEKRALNGPWTRVWAEDSGDWVTVAVEDKGPGFSESVRRKLFVPFVSSKEGGAGLGLFHSRKIMMAHGGRLEVLPDPPTRILCHFPKADNLS